MLRNLYFALLTSKNEGSSPTPADLVGLCEEEGEMEFWTDRAIAVGQARLLSRKSNAENGSVFACSIEASRFDYWYQFDYFADDVELTETDSLRISVDDLSEFFSELRTPPEYVGSYE
ncbi:hypothetical protein [Hyphococcus sp.]|uniref:hypothetical protein n=1 Tax=Hyphococcus sp. TaxID=2038636 RepID=UPI0035C744A2